LAILALLLGIAVLLLIYINCYLKKNLHKAEQTRDTFKNYYQIYNVWISAKNRGRILCKLLVDKGYREVGIYGLGEIGERLFEELSSCNDLNVRCFIDQGKFIQDNYNGVKIVTIDDLVNYPDLNVIIITPFYAREAIDRQLAGKISQNTKTVSFDDLVFDL